MFNAIPHLHPKNVFATLLQEEAEEGGNTVN